jgi:hypothetical protein
MTSLSNNKRAYLHLSVGQLPTLQPAYHRLSPRILLMLVVMLVLMLTACGQQASPPSLIVNEVPLVYPYQREAGDLRETRQTQINIQSDAGLKAADKPLQLTLTEGDGDTHILLRRGETDLLSDNLYQASLAGLCIDATTHSMAFFIHHLAPGIGLDQRALLHNYEQDQWQFRSLPYNEFVSTAEKYTLCDTAEATPHWEHMATQAKVKLCNCNIPQTVFAKPLTEQWQAAIGEVAAYGLFELDESFDMGTPRTINLYHIAKPKQLQTLIEQAIQDEQYEVIEFNQGQASLLIINYVEAPFSNLGYGFIRSSPNREWQLWYTAGDSSKGFYPIKAATQDENGNIQMELCVRDCTWWGEQAVITMDLTTRLFNKVLQ